MPSRSQSTPGHSLRDLLPEARFIGACDIRVASCCGDSRHCHPGDLFVALPGSIDDGHRYVGDAISRGATALLVQHAVGECKLPTCIVSDVQAAYGKICQTLAGNPAKKLKMIGLTGTNGKTTTSLLVASILNAAGMSAGLIGTLGNFDGAEFGPAKLTTPTAPELAQWLARMCANGCTHAVVEISSHAISQSRAAGINFDVVGISNVRHDHLDYHGTLAEYRRTKRRALDSLAPEGVAVLNADDPVCAEFLSELSSPALSIGIDAPCEISALPVEQFISEQTFLLSAGDETVPVRTQLIGRHNIYNCLMAAATGVTYGIDLATIAYGIEKLDKVPGRLERIECGQPFSVFVDYAHTAEALAVTLDTLRLLVSGRLTCVFGAGGDRDRQKRPKMGGVVENRADIAYLTNDNPRNEDPKLIAREVLAGFINPSKAHVVLDRAEAIARALDGAQEGDCVLIAGKGHEDYQVVGDKRLYFDDRAFAREWLYEQCSGTDFSRAA